MSLPLNLNEIVVRNVVRGQSNLSPSTTNGDSSDAFQIGTQTTERAGTSDEIRGERKKATTETGYIVKNYIYRKHKFITKPDDLQYDRQSNSDSICAIYFDNVTLNDVNNEVTRMKMWDVARITIPVSLNGQRNNTNKAIRNALFDSKSICVSMYCGTVTHTAPRPSC